MKTTNLNPSKFLQVKNTFDTITSKNAQNYRLVLFWIIVFELFAATLEYLFFSNSSAYITNISVSLYKELFIGIVLTLFIWFCVYTFIFPTKNNLMLLLLFAIVNVYLLITSDLTFSFLLHNIEPTHFFQTAFSVALILELFIKLLITYLIYRLVITYQNQKK